MQQDDFINYHDFYKISISIKTKETIDKMDSRRSKKEKMLMRRRRRG